MKLLALLAVSVAMAVAVFGQSGLDPIPLSLPKPLFEGTPVPPNVPNLEKPSGRPRPPFLAPAGVANVALRKLVVSSDADPVIGNIDMITVLESYGVGFRPGFTCRLGEFMPLSPAEVEDMELRKKGEAGQRAIETSQVELEGADAPQGDAESAPADEPATAPADAEN